MDWYRIILRPVAPTLTPWQADTIFGHLCWALLRLEGAGVLGTFLELYGIGSPQLVLSNGCPCDLLPRPLLGARHSGPDTRSVELRRDEARAAKKARKAQWLTPGEFQRARQGEVVIPTSPHPYREAVMMHNTISRLTGTTGEEGSLFSLEGSALAAENEEDRFITVYARVDPGFVASLGRCLAYLQETGYGKRKSVGYGALKEARLEKFDGFPLVEGENGFVSLSNYVPSAGDPTDGVWHTVVKRGRLGEEFATKATEDGNPRPFKRPVVMLTAGSCFFHDGAPRPFYGRLVEKVHDDEDNFGQVVQYGLALAVGMRLPPKEDRA